MVLRRVALLVAAVVCTASAARAQWRVEAIHTFSGGADGAAPVADLVVGTDGNFYGTTSRGGAYGKGTLFRMTPSGTMTVLHAFAGEPTDGENPFGRLVVGGDGNVYGYTNEGGAGTWVFGTIFRVTPAGDYTLVHSFDGTDGAFPTGLIAARDGNLYGTANGGGYNGGRQGVAFRLSTSGAFSVIHAFAGGADDSTNPAALTEATDGTFYGVASDVFPFLGNGSLFRMTAAGEVTKLHVFTGGAGGSAPASALFLASDGNFYGSTAGGGSHAEGVVYRLTPGGAFTVIYDGLRRGSSDWIEATDGRLYATDLFGSDLTLGARDLSQRAGSIFSITLSGNLSRLYSFPLERSGLPRGVEHATRLVQRPDGSFYGMAKDNGGAYGFVYRLRYVPLIGFDNDAATDMPLYDATSGTWRILTSSSGYRSSLAISWGGPGYMPVPDDYDGDGRLDIAVYHIATGGWHILTSSSNYTEALVRQWGGNGYTPVPGDYDRDGRADFAVYRRPTGRWSVLTSTSGYTKTLSITLGGPGDVPVRADFDGDAVADAAVYAPATGAWRVLTSSSGYRTPITTTLGGPGYAPVAADYDGDRRTDFAVYDQAGGTWSVRQSSSDFATTWTQGWGGSGYTAVPGDYDADGKSDLALYNEALGEWFVLQSSGQFTTTLRVVWGTAIDAPIASLPGRVAWTDSLRATDFDGDGASDIVVYEPSAGTWSILTSSTHFTQTSTIAWGGPGDTPVPGDYDGDGRTDVATFNDSSGLWSIRRTSYPPLTAVLGGPGDIPVARDYDGDAITDIAVYTPATGVWRMLLSTTGFAATRTITWGGPGWTPVPGDYDGDGKADLGVYVGDYWQGWRVLLAAADYSTTLAMDWGGHGYTPVPADYDGDGRNDFAVCRNVTGDWYVLKSGFTYTTAFGLPWGEEVETPRTADYDGDGIADMASYDSTTGEWYVVLSSSYFTLSIERTLGGAGFILPRMP